MHLTLNKIAANLTGKIDSIEINNYIYRNIALNGYFTEKTWDGSIKINDENLKLDLQGLLNFTNKLPEFDFTLNVANANLFKLNIDKLDTTSSLNLLLTSNFKGNSIDNLDGEIKLLNSSFKKYNKTLEVYDFSIRTFTEDSKPILSLRTDFVDADIRGYYNFATIGSIFKSTLSALMPSRFPVVAKRNDLGRNNFTFDIRLKKTDQLNEFFKTGFLIADNSFVKGVVSPDSVIIIDGGAKSFTLKNTVFRDLAFNSNISGSDLSLNVSSSALSILGQSDHKRF